MGMTVNVENQEIPVEEDTTAADVKAEANLNDDAVLTYRGEDGFDSLNDDDVVVEHVDEGTRLEPQPLADNNVFGGA
ncbi:hypothetical protein PN419_17605 [Halorubrum ezzemoulense]|jgi:sulfur carrier protein ThiS|uniref:Uncharacterized protein n=1 Tax=Halorubrum ezzemoulense TaxID=337243 RepID=A0A256JE12_HALEZ|nr:MULTISPECIES: hypothetical protein [Halorubrum]MDB2238784.1 hypothetical protein [Halorubrum ezzemoulense]MDB2249405.1 hypothetical protein [Halorubrum ezzemoulense]MDB2272293.1 hypothetical protein [Halorubrum ezzemoulense]MDB9234978.1 hypothetical protein [Halorubrum ezzemoulense]MDB9250790.1 hypothetical protein [Halorubrum ezzemoulense]